MTTALRDFIATRETEIREQQRALKGELRELQIAKAALDGQASAASSAVAGTGPTIKEMAREVLSGQPGGLNSAGILDGIKKMFGRDIERTSLSPQLSRLKDDGELILSGEVWFTAQHHQAAFDRELAELNAVFNGEYQRAPNAIPPMPTNTNWDDDDPPF